MQNYELPGKFIILARSSITSCRFFKAVIVSKFYHRKFIKWQKCCLFFVSLRLNTQINRHASNNFLSIWYLQFDIMPSLLHFNGPYFFSFTLKYFLHFYLSIVEIQIFDLLCIRTTRKKKTFIYIYKFCFYCLTFI